jgi:hypothetical protein
MKTLISIRLLQKMACYICICISIYSYLDRQCVRSDLLLCSRVCTIIKTIKQRVIHIVHTCKAMDMEIRETIKVKNGCLSFPTCKTYLSCDAFAVRRAISSIPWAIVFLVAYRLTFMTGCLFD